MDGMVVQVESNGKNSIMPYLWLVWMERKDQIFEYKEKHLKNYGKE